MRGSKLEPRSPAQPERVLGALPLLDGAAIEGTLIAAVEARSAWAADHAGRAEALHEWSRHLEAHHDEVVDLVVAEVGKPIREARVEVDRGIHILRYYAQLVFDERGLLYPSPAGTRLEVEHVPIGTALMLTPWNFPVAIPLWKMAPALAYGNTVLLRPSSSAALIAARLVELTDAAVPSGVLGFVPSEVAAVDGLLRDDRIGAVSFTGSTEVGRQVIGAVTARGGAVQAEMGGQNASVVLADADLDIAAATIADAAMGYAGQKCTATSRVVVDRAVADRFVPLLVDHVRALQVDDPADESTVVGPLISLVAREGVASAVRQVAARGGRVLTGARPMDRAGWFYEPTLVALQDASDPFAQDETFGPAASVLVAGSEEQVIEIANDSRYGLSGAVFSRNPDHGLAVARRLDVGLVRVNASTAGVEFYVPFGGNRGSSFGPREQGRAAREVFTKTRTIFVRD